MSEEKILIVDDEEDIIELIRYNLKKAGYNVISASTGENAIKKVRQNNIDLIILDLMLPGIDGLETAKRLKADPASYQTPIIIVSAKGEETDIVTGLEIGADDYITKPFSPHILLARVRATLRRKNKIAPDKTAPLKIHNLRIDPIRRKVEIKKKQIELTYTEFQILYYLAGHPGWVFTRSQIVDGVKGENYNVTDRSVDVQIVGLRKKLGNCENYIQTVRGVGYRFKE